MQNDLEDGIVFPTDDMSQAERINAYRKLISHYSDLPTDATKDMLFELAYPCASGQVDGPA